LRVFLFLRNLLTSSSISFNFLPEIFDILEHRRYLLQQTLFFLL
jgi:hypothetical protein